MELSTPFVSKSHPLLRMSDATVHVPFTYEGIQRYFLYKTTLYPGVDAFPFEADTPVDLPTLAQSLHSVARHHSTPLPPCTFQWSSYIASLPSEKAARAWIFREYVFSRIMLFLSHHLPGKSVLHFLDKDRIVPPLFDLQKSNYTTVGSSNLTSDMDITIQGAHSAFVISILEDLYYCLSERYDIPLRCWDIEFYGDFHILKSLYTNVSKFDTRTRVKMLSYAYMSYFRSTHSKSVEQVSPLARLLGSLFLDKLSSSLSVDLVIRRALYEWNDTAKDGVLDRERFYTLFQKAEDIMNLVKPFLHTLPSKKVVSRDMLEGHPYAVDVFDLIAQADIHRAESYVLPSTAVHVVDMEQTKDALYTNNLPDAWISSNARIGVDSFSYIASAIEQLGYLEHYHSLEVSCNKKGIKYWGRLVRALQQASLLSASSSLLDAATELNAFRKSSADTRCLYNIHKLLDRMEKELGTQTRAVSLSTTRRAPRSNATKRSATHRVRSRIRGRALPNLLKQRVALPSVEVGLGREY